MPATPGASTSQGPSKSQGVDPMCASLKLQYVELELNHDLLAVTEENLAVLQQLKVDHAMVSALCGLVGAVRQVGSGSPMRSVVGGIPLQVKGVSQVEVSMPRVEVNGWAGRGRGRRGRWCWRWLM